MTEAAKKLLIGMLKASAENGRGDVFMRDFLPKINDRKDIFEAVGLLHNMNMRRDEDYNEIDEYGLTLYLIKELQKELER